MSVRAKPERRRVFLAAVIAHSNNRIAAQLKPCGNLVRPFPFTMARLLISFPHFPESQFHFRFHLHIVPTSLFPVPTTKPIPKFVKCRWLPAIWATVVITVMIIVEDGVFAKSFTILHVGDGVLTSLFAGEAC